MQVEPISKAGHYIYAYGNCWQKYVGKVDLEGVDWKKLVEVD
ncbi:hypothetical protein [Klebsiella pneumoniae]|nr:hypothetical protein [Klebsiella pneumoniae]